MSPNLVFSVADDGHLEARARRAGRPTATLRFLADGLEVSATNAQPVVLSWDDNTNGNPNGLSTDGWCITSWQQSRSGAIGIAVRVFGDLIPPVEQIRRATSTPWRRIVGAYGSSPGSRLLPVLVRGDGFGTAQSEQLLVAALCAVLHDVPERRPRLDVIDHVGQLARDLDRSRLSVHSPLTGLKGDTVDIDVAMRHLGYVHPYGRPLPGSAVPPEGEVIERVTAALSANAYRHGRDVEREQVERLVRRNFTDVAPWPFTGLVDGT